MLTVPPNSEHIFDEAHKKAKVDAEQTPMPKPPAKAKNDKHKKGDNAKPRRVRTRNERTIASDKLYQKERSKAKKQKRKRDKAEKDKNERRRGCNKDKQREASRVVARQ